MQQQLKIHRFLLAAWLIWSCSLAVHAKDGSLASAPPAYRFQSTSSLFDRPVVPVAAPVIQEYRPSSNASSAPFVIYRTSEARTSGVQFDYNISGGGSGGSGRHSGPQGPVFNTQMPQTIAFKTTSVLAPSADKPAVEASVPRLPKRRSSGWDDDPADSGDPIGVGSTPAPVGEPLVMLLMALLYGAYMCVRRVKKNNPRICKKASLHS